MSDLDESFAQLLGRQPSDAERQELYRVRDALGLKNNDALWLVIMVLQHYKGEYKDIPNEIKAVVEEVLANVNATAVAVMKAAAEAAKADLAAAVAEAAHQVARDVAIKEKVQWIALSAVTVAICFFAVFWMTDYRSYNAGYNSGYGVGYRESKDEKAAAAWANTPEGKLAYRFAQAGALQRLAHCQGNGWQTKQGYCYPYPLDNKVHGWRLP